MSQKPFNFKGFLAPRAPNHCFHNGLAHIARHGFWDFGGAVFSLVGPRSRICFRVTIGPFESPTWRQALVRSWVFSALTRLLDPTLSSCMCVWKGAWHPGLHRVGVRAIPLAKGASPKVSLAYVELLAWRVIRPRGVFAVRWQGHVSMTLAPKNMIFHEPLSEEIGIFPRSLA